MPSAAHPYGSDAPVALPVAITLTGALRDEVARWVEQSLGWQVVPVGGPPRPVVALVRTEDVGSSTVPCAVVVAGAPDGDAVRAGLQTGALDVVGWPGDRDRLAALARPRPDDGSPAVGARPLLVGGLGGGVGCSTVVLGLGGLAAWSGARTIACGADDLLGLAGLSWDGPGGAEIAGLGLEGGAEVGRLSRPVPGVSDLRVLGRGRAVREVGGWPADLVVVDAGPCPTGAPDPDDAETHGGLPTERRSGVDLLVARPDGRLARHLDHGASPPALVLVGDGPVPRRAVRRALGREPAVRLPDAVRVSAAGVRGRVPADLPGAWLARLRPLVKRVLARRAETAGTDGGDPRATLAATGSGTP